MSYLYAPENTGIMELSKNYIPSETEDKWSEHWLGQRYFNSHPDGRPPFTVVIPPPNVTGVLHMGHTLNETVQDILVRRARMSGFNACWVPGCDHASIATEAKVVGMLKERGIEKKDLSREQFLEYAYEWKEKYGGLIYHQIKKLGCSVDWDRVAFTMDPDYYRAVIKIFIELFEQGLVYRGARMIHWDPQARTALSDEEVEYREENGKLYYVRYRVEGTDEFIMIATQRPETIMGDTAVCVNPNDERYAWLAGKQVIVPLVNRRVPVIFDEYVDPAFGTGALKVTPAHDINDYNLGLKHKLPIIDTLNEDGTLSAAAEVFVGMDRFAARKKAVEQLKADGLLAKEEDYQTRLGYSQRSNAVVEPRISTQWFVRMKELAGPALKAVNDGHITIYPLNRFNATYTNWMESIHDWCISRQLWWGQRIPAWYDADGKMVVAADEASARKRYAEQHGGSPAGGSGGQIALRQDEDVLDTWFSSWLWPEEVFKGITNPGNPDIEYYYPGAVLVTGQDIIFFWVARMIMAGLYTAPKDRPVEKRIPFHDVYFTGIVRDKLGRKMSKQLGNSPDLLELIDKYGADAVRFGIMISSPAGNDLLFDEAALEQGRNFNNKLWNALKLVKMWEGRQGAAEAGRGAGTGGSETGRDADFAVQWFGSRLNEVRAELDRLFSEYRVSEALKTLYSLIWDDFCSWYLEWVKPGYEQAIDAGVYRQTVDYFEQLVHLLHPFMPFITEELYHLLADHSDDLCVCQYAAVGSIDVAVLSEGSLLKDAITALRDARNKAQLRQKDRVSLHIQSASEGIYLRIMPILAKQVNADPVDFTADAIPGTLTVVSGKDKFYIGAEQKIDSGHQKQELLKELEYLRGFLASVTKKLSNERFVQNAKPDIVNMEVKKKEDAETKIRVLEESLAGL
jgi:valyl-tRNA synthetase